MMSDNHSIPILRKPDTYSLQFMCIDYFANSEWCGAYQITLIFTLKRIHRYGCPITWFIRKEVAILTNQALGEVDDKISRQGIDYLCSGG